MLSNKNQKIGIVLSGFPRLSETFILHELLEFERQGLEPVIFPLKRGQQGPLPREIQFLQSPLVYVPVQFTLAFFGETVCVLKEMLKRNSVTTLKIAAAFLLTGKKEKEFNRLKSLFRLLWFCRKVKEMGVVSLHAHFAHDPTTMTWWAARLLNIPYSFTAHAKDIYCYSQKWLERKLHDAEFVVTCTDYNRRYLEEISPNGTPIHCLYHGIDLQKFVPNTPLNPPSRGESSADPFSKRESIRLKRPDSTLETSPLHSPLEGGEGGVTDVARHPYSRVYGENPQEDSLKAALRTSQRSNLKVEHPTKYQTAPLLLAVGRLVEKKGFPYLIEACKQLREQGIQFRCEIAGDGPMHAQLEKQVWQSGLDDAIVLHGALPPEEIKKFYAQASLFVLPSFITKSGDRDGIPNVILEAMAMALPVVATRVSGIPEAIVHEETGLLVPEKDADALAQAIINLLSNPARRQQLGNAGRERVTHKFTLEANVKQKMELMLG